jgi:hypothetical protein
MEAYRYESCRETKGYSRWRLPMQDAYMKNLKYLPYALAAAGFFAAFEYHRSGDPADHRLAA